MSGRFYSLLFVKIELGAYDFAAVAYMRVVCRARSLGFFCASSMFSSVRTYLLRCDATAMGAKVPHILQHQVCDAIHGGSTKISILRISWYLSCIYMFLVYGQW